MINIVNYKIDGFQNEAQFVNYLHGKRVKDLEPIYQDMLRKLYGDVSKWRKVKAVVDKTKKKYDIVIQIGKEKKRQMWKTPGIFSSDVEKEFKDHMIFRYPWR